MVNCPNCGYQNLAGEKYCSECGASLTVARGGVAQAIKCRRCGMDSPPGKKFCSQCGESLPGQGTTNPQVRPPSPDPLPVTDPPSTNKLLDPDTLLQGRYRIAKLIGQGGMGAIYLAKDTRFSNKQCVIKEMLDYFTDPEMRQRATQNFHREADLLSRLRHEGIPEVYDRFTEGNRHYLVMQYIDGIDLEQMMLDKDGHFEERDVLGWSMQICDLLSYLHHQKPPIIYRDMKPANLILSRKTRVYMVDFGIARHFNPVSKGTMIGTQGYAPPEQYRGQEEPRSDIYALGATMHHLLTGRDPQTEPPFSFPAVRQLNPRVSAATEKIISKALQNDPDKRFATAEDMLKALMEVSQQNASAVKICPHCHETISITKIFCPHCDQYIAAHTAGQVTEQMVGAGTLRNLTTFLTRRLQGQFNSRQQMIKGMAFLVMLCGVLVVAVAVLIFLLITRGA